MWDVWLCYGSTKLCPLADTDREQAANLIVELKKESLVSSAQFLEAFRELVAQMAEKEQEIPRIYSHVAGKLFNNK